MRRGLTLLVLSAAVLAPATAEATVFRVVNERGIPQATFYRVNGVGPMLGSGDGMTDVPVDAGDTVSFSRAPGPGGCTEPEDAGVEHKVASPPPAEVTITLPVTTGDLYRPDNDNGERWIIGQLNRRRSERGLPPLTVSSTLNRAADAVAHDSAVKKAATGSFPFPPPFCDVIHLDWGFPSYNFSIVDQHGTDPRSAFEHWSDGSPRETRGTLGDWDAVGVGDGGGGFIAYFARCPAEFAARCELTGDRGDPDIVLPPAQTTPGGGGGGGGAGGGAGGGGGAGAGGGAGGSGAGGTAGGGQAKPAAGTAKAKGRPRARANARSRFRGTIVASCTAQPGCYVAGTAVAAPKRARGRSAAKPVLARGGFPLAQGASKKVALTVNQAGQRALERTGRLRLLVTVTVKAPGHTAAVAKRTVVLRAARR